MATQYQDVSALPSSTYRDYILTYADMWDHYVIYQTEQNQYIGYIWDDWGNSTLITIDRQNQTGFNNRWRTTLQKDVQHDYTIIEPMYAYSTEKEDGQYYMPQNYQAISSMSQIILTTVITFVLVFRGVFLRKH